MMDTLEQQDRDEQDIARLLRAVGPRRELPQALRPQWETTFRAELQRVLERRKRLRNTVLIGSCASVAEVGRQRRGDSPDRIQVQSAGLGVLRVQPDPIRLHLRQ